MAVARERSPVVLMDRVRGESGELINQFSLTSIKYRVFVYESHENATADIDGEEVGTEATLDVAEVVFDELQLDQPWDVERDPEGYNFRFALPGSRRPTPGWHRIEIWFTPSTSGDPYPLVWLVKSLPLASI